MSVKDFPPDRLANSGAGKWDILAGATSWRLWAFLGLQDIRARYRRSSFGPLWLALGLGVTILGIGILYSQILKTPSGTFIPYFALSLLIWTLIASVMTESSTLFISAAGTMMAVRIPYTTFVLRCIVRNLVVMAHCIAPVIIAFAAFKYPITANALASIFGLLLLVANLYWISLGIAMVCTRFRDLGQIVLYATQLTLFMTPIIWQPTQLKQNSPALLYNPFYHLIELIRSPIFYNRIPWNSYIFCTILLVVGSGIVLFSFTRLRRQIIFWI